LISKRSARRHVRSWDETYCAIVFVARAWVSQRQLPIRAVRISFKRVAFQKVLGNGKNALDFHISHSTWGECLKTLIGPICFVRLERSKDCESIDCPIRQTWAELIVSVVSFERSYWFGPAANVTQDATVEHNGGRCASNCRRVFRLSPGVRITPRPNEQTRTARPFGGLP
jgi:hypothetical protein